MTDRIYLWALRALVFTLPFTLGGAVADWLRAHEHHDVPVLVGAWFIWAAMLLATIVPHSVSRTVARTSAIAITAAAIVLPQSRHHAIDILNAVIVLALTYSPAAIMWWINGTAYPNERRYTLRTPSLLTVGPIGLAYLVVIGAPVASFLYLSNDQWAAGLLFAFAGAIPVAFCARAIHQLGRRWVVFVPAGVVLHDPMTLTDPILFQRSVIERFAPAPADTDALDLTQSALGLSIELDLHEKVPMVLSRGGGKTESGSSARLMFTPSHPGAVLAEATRRKIPR